MQEILVNTDLYFHGLQKVMVSCPFPWELGLNLLAICLG